MPFDARSPIFDRDSRLLARWLLAVAAMVWAMVALGGATRLTGSGLSIMEWAPFRGTLPPLHEAEWQRLFGLYRTIPQYALVNAGIDLAGFKQIFWLEWAHRLWGRLIGLAFLLPLLWFAYRGLVPRRLLPRLGVLFVLGGMQGAIGWFMVASGFEADRTAVSAYRLVAHLGMALGLYAALVWTALGLLRPAAEVLPADARAVRGAAHAAAALLLLAMLAGGFVAGLKAGFTYNSFPLMDGRLVPAGYADLSPWVRNWFENIPAVQFNHRLLATLGGLAALAAAGLGWRRLPAGLARQAALGLGAAVALQYALGVATLLLVVPVWLGTLHQGTAVLVLTMVLVLLHAVRQPGPAEDVVPGGTAGARIPRPTPGKPGQ
jgi:cytochrome c oxidase assembly protein subunit 15